MKKNLIRILLVVALLVVVGVAVVFMYLDSIVKKGFETVGPQLTKVEMKLGNAKISPFSGKGQLNDIFIGNPANYKTAGAIKVGEVRLALNPKSVLSKTVEIQEIAIVNPEITYEGGLTGSNLKDILKNVEAFAGAETAASSSGAKSSKQIMVKDLSVTGGKITVALSLLGGKPLTVPLPDIHLSDIGTKEGGVSIAELTKQVMGSILASTTKVVTEAVSGIGKGVKEVGSGAAETVDKAAKGLKGLFKKN